MATDAGAPPTHPDCADQAARAAARARVTALRELLREGCPHACANRGTDACPYRRRLLDKLRAAGDRAGDGEREP